MTFDIHTLFGAFKFVINKWGKKKLNIISVRVLNFSFKHVRYYYRRSFSYLAYDASIFFFGSTEINFL